MPYDVIVDDIGPDQWEQCAREFADYSVYQTWAYQETRAKADRQQISRIIIKDDNGSVMTMCQIRIKHVKPLGFKIGYIQWGPLIRAKDGTIKCCSRVLNILRETYVGTKVNVLRIVPNVIDDQVGKDVSSVLKSCGFERVQSVRPYRTMILPLDIDESEMRNRLHRSWRRYLKRAEKNDIEIRQGTDIEFLELLDKLYTSALERKKFKGLDPKEFVETQKLLSPHEKMNIVLAYYQGQVVTAHATSHLGDTALGILAASNEEGLKCWASYKVWWKTLLAGKQAGMTKYDLGGIDPVGNPNVYQFKLRMGSKEIFHIGAFEAYSSVPARIVWYMSEKIYNLLKR
jgi:lipid II:glycine glycyltransferase (peptidoglycan interpeptide bridge formation enzyme)